MTKFNFDSITISEKYDALIIQFNENELLYSYIIGCFYMKIDKVMKQREMYFSSYLSKRYLAHEDTSNYLNGTLTVFNVNCYKEFGEDKLNLDKLKYLYKKLYGI